MQVPESYWVNSDKSRIKNWSSPTGRQFRSGPPDPNPLPWSCDFMLVFKPELSSDPIIPLLTSFLHVLSLNLQVLNVLLVCGLASSFLMIANHCLFFKGVYSWLCVLFWYVSCSFDLILDWPTLSSSISSFIIQSLYYTITLNETFIFCYL